VAKYHQSPPLWRLGFNPSTVDVGFMMYSVAVGQVLLYVLWFSFVNWHSMNASYSFLNDVGDIIINVVKSSCRVPIILVRFQRNLNFIDRFSKNAQILNFTKLCIMGAELFHADSQT
jgi:hypothetical protein